MRIAGNITFLLLLAGFCGAQDTNFATGPQYLMTFGSPLFVHSIATPSLSFETPLVQPGESEPVTSQVSPEEYEAVSSVLDAQQQTYLFSVYYGVPLVNVIELSFREESSATALPASITENGVIALTDAQALRDRGYGVPLSEAATYSKAHRSPAPRVYTNSDVERLPPIS